MTISDQGDSDLLTIAEGNAAWFPIYSVVWFISSCLCSFKFIKPRRWNKTIDTVFSEITKSYIQIPKLILQDISYVHTTQVHWGIAGAMLCQNLQRCNNASSVVPVTTIASPASVALNITSVWLDDQVSHCGVMLALRGLSFGLSCSATPKNEPANEADSVALMTGGALWMLGLEKQ